MRDLPIALLGADVLRQRADDVTVFDAALQELVLAMFRTMYRANGQGLAAPQVGVLQRIVVIDMPDEDSPALALINPCIVERSVETASYEEGCLSIPGVTARVERSRRVIVEAFTPQGQTLRIDAEDELADCLQHEIDHLDGVLYIDHLGSLRRQLLLKKYRKSEQRKRA